MMCGVVDQFVQPAVVDIPYLTGAVHFNGSTFLKRNAVLTGWGTPSKFTAVLWSKLSVCNDGIFSDANFFTQGTTSDNGNKYINVNVGGTYFDSFGVGSILSATWQAMLISLDLAVANASVQRLYLGDTDVRVPGDSAEGGNTTITAGTDFWFGQDGFNVKITGDIADFRLWLGFALDFNNINNRRLFVRSNGKPADRAAAVALMGTPKIQFVATPGSEVATFSSNGGTGGAFTTTGTLTVASTSPTD
jgi:hypothetical protein